MRDLHLLPTHPTRQLKVVIARDTECIAARHHLLHQPQDIHHSRTPIHQVAHKDCLAPARMLAVDVSQLREQFFEFVAAAVDVADHIERPRLALLVVEDRRAPDLDAVQLFRIQNMNIAEAFALKPVNAAPQAVHLPFDDVRSKVAVGARGVSPDTNSFRNVQHQRHRNRIELPRDLHELLAVTCLYIRRIDHSQPHSPQPDRQQMLERLKRIGCATLVRLVVAHQAAKIVGRQDLSRLEKLSRKGRLARSRSANQQHQTVFRKLNSHE